MWEGKLAFVVFVGLCAALARCDDEGGNVHTIVVTDCSRYFAFQTMGAVYSHWKALQPGPMTRVMCCNEADAKSVTQEELDLVNTHIAPDFTVHPETGDVYGAYNKPGAVLDFLEKNDIKEEFVFIVDGDMILRHPVTPQQMGARQGLGISARYAYLKGVNNRLAVKHIPYISPRQDTRGGVLGRRADQVGGFFLTHRDDMRRVAPLWLKFTGDVRQDPDAWNLTGDVYSTEPGSKPWISEMYGYAFGAATAGLWHKIADGAMIYPEYVPNRIPKIIHYGLLYDIPGTNFSFDKHWHEDFDPFLCPPWENSGKKRKGGMFPHPPHPWEVTGNTKWERYAHLISIESVNTLNEAFCQRHMKKCPPSAQLLEECGKTHNIAVELEKELEVMEDAVCMDRESSELCLSWKQSGECEKNEGFMEESCAKTCGSCVKTPPRRIFDLTPLSATVDVIKAPEGNAEHSSIHAPEKTSNGRDETGTGQGFHAPEVVTNQGVHAPKDVKGQGFHAPEVVTNEGFHAPEDVKGQRFHAPEVVKGQGVHAPGSKKSNRKAHPIDQASTDLKTQGVWVRGTKAVVADSDVIQDSTLGRNFSFQSLLVVQVWMWGLVILGAMSLFRMRTRAKTRYLTREEGLVGMI